MTAVKPGIPKLNIPKMRTASPKSAIAANLGAASRNAGVSYGIFAQRTLTGTGLHLNSRTFNSASISATRHALNDNRTMLFNNIGMPHQCNHNNGNNTMNKFMAGMMAMQMLAQMGAQTAQIINDAKANRADKTDKTVKKDKTDNVGKIGNTNANANDARNASASVKSFDTINSSIATTIGNANTLTEQCDTLDESTNALIKSKFNNGSQAAKGLELAGLNIDNIANIELVDVTLPEAPAVKDFDNAVKDLEGNDKKLEAKATEIDGNITTCTNIKTRLQRALSSENRKNLTPEKIAEFENQLAQIDAAIKALEAAKKEIKTARDTLKEQKSQMNAYKDQMKDLTNQKHDLAKSQKKDLDDLNKKRNELKNEINALRGQAFNQKDQGKLAKKIQEYNGIIAQMVTLYTSLSNINGQGNSVTSVTDAEGKNPVNLSSLSSFANIANEKIDELPEAGSGEELGDRALNSIAQGTTVKIDGISYTRTEKGWVDERGNELTSLDALTTVYGNQPSQSSFNIPPMSFGGGANSRGLSGLGAGALNMSEFKPEGTITVNGKDYIPTVGGKYICNGITYTSEQVFRMQMAQYQQTPENS